MVNQVAGIVMLAGLQLGLGLTVSLWAERHSRWIRQLVTALSAAQAIIGAVSLASLSFGLIDLREPIALWGCLSFQVNSTTGLMLLLVSFIGWITCRYSIRYLDGDARQGQYFQWMSFTIGAVALMVLSADLLTFGIFWSLTSFGLHHLLLHYGERSAAQRAAWTKFLISRVGDLAVLLAICLFYPIVKSLQFSDLALAAVDPNVANLPAFQAGTIALALGVIVKSAQIPFHTWLPLTMETPTPVSALMHAGIVNAGGFLLVRSSPLVGASSFAQTLLVVSGTVTACLASSIMLTQTSVKKKLAYSTIAQMGFMLMQCGLAAYSAAMLHILAHSLYKAYEFLSSGSVITRRAATQTVPMAQRPVHWTAVLAIMCSLIGLAWCMLTIVGQDPLNKSGGWLLTGILCAALTTWLVHIVSLAKWALMLRAGGAAVLLVAFYAVCFATVDSMVQPMLPQGAKTGGADWPVALFVLMAFAGLFLFQIALMSPQTIYKLRFWQIHAVNGFYIESWLRRQMEFLIDRRNHNPTR